MPFRKPYASGQAATSSSSGHQVLASNVSHIVAPAVGNILPPAAAVVPRDPLTSCLDANGTYVCTAYNSRCLIIQKVTPQQFVPYETEIPPYDEFIEYDKFPHDGYYYTALDANYDQTPIHHHGEMPSDNKRVLQPIIKTLLRRL
ncbi:hypothetical protein DMENIID0001_125300 [Sergentomyia squamirostris]